MIDKTKNKKFDRAVKSIIASGMVGVAALAMPGCRMEAPADAYSQTAPDENLVGRMTFARDDGSVGDLDLTVLTQRGEEMIAFVIPFGRDMRNLRDVKITYSDKFRKTIREMVENMKNKYDIQGDEYGLVSIEIERNADYIDFPESASFKAMISAADAGVIYQAGKRALNMEHVTFVETGRFIGDDLYWVSSYPALHPRSAAAKPLPLQTKKEQEALLRAAGVRRVGEIKAAGKSQARVKNVMLPMPDKSR